MNGNPFVIGLQTDWQGADGRTLGMQYPQTNPTTTAEFLVQHGMEYSPLALNEALAYQYMPPAGANAGNPVARLAVEVANMLTDDGTAAPIAGGTTDNSESDLTTSMLDGWDFVVMYDGYGYGRPDPVTGELPPAGLLNAGSIYPTVNNMPSTAAYPSSTTITNPNLTSPPTTFQAIISTSQLGQNTPATTWPTNVFALQQVFTDGTTQERVINALREGAAVQSNNNTAGIKGGGSFFQVGWTSPALTPPPPPGAPPCLPGESGGVAAFPINDATFPPVFGLPVPAADTVPGTFMSGQTVWIWVYLRRPANPFDTRPYAYREMITVDAIRIPFTYAAPVAGTAVPLPGAAVSGPNTTAPPTVYSVQRLQPYRGGQLVPILPGTDGMGAGANNPVPATCWGYSEQTVNGSYPSNGPGPNQTQSNNTLGGSNAYGLYVQATPVGGNSSFYIPHTFAVPGAGNAASGTPSTVKNGTNTKWDVARDYFVFNDRDFVSAAELTLVPGCPPGLFTKQFVENNDPWDSNTFTGGTITVNGQSQAYSGALQPSSGVASTTPATSATSPTFDASTFPPAESQTYPYLIDKFFYSAASVGCRRSTPRPTAPYPNLVGGWTGDGWHKLLEFVEVPSSANGAIGPVARGDNFDWLRQDLKPGLLNLNLIIDEEVFFGLMDELRLNDTLNTTIATPLNQIPYVVDADRPVRLPRHEHDRADLPVGEHGVQRFPPDLGRRDRSTRPRARRALAGPRLYLFRCGRRREPRDQGRLLRLPQAPRRRIGLPLCLGLGRDRLGAGAAVQHRLGVQ